MPLIVGNHSFPSAARHPAGCALPSPSLEIMPSAMPYEIDVIEPERPSAKSVNSARLTLKIPRLPSIQKLPRSSSRMRETKSSNRPSLVVTGVKRPFLKRFNPPPYVPSQSVPSGSSTIART